MKIFNFNITRKKDTPETSSVDLFKFAMPEIPVIREVQGKDWVLYGENNLYPLKLSVLPNQSAIHNSIVGGKAKMMAGKGLLINGTQTKEQSKDALLKLDRKTQLDYAHFLSNPNGSQDMQEIIDAVSLDWQTYGAYAIEVVWSMDFTRIATVKYVEVKNLRMGKMCDGKINEYWYSRNWALTNKDGYRPNKIAAFDPDNKQEYNQIIYVKNGTLEYYGEPFYKGSLTWIDIDAKMANFHNSNIENGFAPSMALKFYQKPASPEEQSKVISDIKKAYSGGQNAGKAMIFFSDGKDLAPDMEPINVSNLDKQYIALSELAVQNILTGAQVTSPALFGIAVPGSLSNGTELETAYKIFNNSVIAPDRLKVEKTLNRILAINKIPVTVTIEAFNPLDDIQVIQSANDMVLASLNTLSPLVATKVLESMSEDEIRALASLPPKVQEAPDATQPITPIA